MFEKIADKAAQVFSKKAVEHTKEIIVQDVKDNHTGYVMAGITGLVITVGVVSVIKLLMGGGAPSVPTYSVTYNYYLSPEQAAEVVKAIPGPPRV